MSRGVPAANPARMEGKPTVAERHPLCISCEAFGQQKTVVSGKNFLAVIDRRPSRLRSSPESLSGNDRRAAVVPTSSMMHCWSPVGEKRLRPMPIALSVFPLLRSRCVRVKCWTLFSIPPGFIAVFCLMVWREFLMQLQRNSKISAWKVFVIVDYCTSLCRIRYHT